MMDYLYLVLGGTPEGGALAHYQLGFEFCSGNALALGFIKAR